MAADQYGLINYIQARAAGVSASAIQRRVSTGLWERLLPRVFRIAGTPSSWLQEHMAAHLYVAGHSAAWGPTAARMWGFAGFEGAPIEIATTASAKRARGLPFKIHRLDEHLLEEIVLVDRIPVTSVPQTILHLAGVKHRLVEPALDQALREGLTTVPKIWLLYEKEWIRGRRGVAILRALLLERTLTNAPSESALEDLMWNVIRDYALPVPIAQYTVGLPIGDVRIDFAYPADRLAIECDGWAWHMDRDAFERDRARDIDLQGLGWRVLRFTWARLKFDPGGVASQIEHHLGRATGM